MRVSRYRHSIFKINIRRYQTDDALEVDAVCDIDSSDRTKELVVCGVELGQ